ncbi:murein L,D-transpeptidase [Streptomyces mashuensis]|uniref:Murein L,D-transpeptidase n=1 Tax=Streptomyces mashuensis TaxID=33904 RepID=A0A919B7R2_9ACTN|nr:L,D-transpeptidase [Streptomyces mashuensis]GHF59548.1 murein L,D-transpeptidase [Streptomyces mashuensis]
MSTPHAGRRARRGTLPAGLLLAAATVWAGTAAGAAGPAAPAPPCTAGTGPYQWQLEAYLKLPQDGRQSVADCRAIAAFQRREHVTPANGYAGLATYRAVLVAQARRNPNASGACPLRSRRVACVDLTRQLLWVNKAKTQKGRTVLYGPVPVRTGRAGQTTRTGTHTIYWKHKNHVSTIYANAPMPYAQFFNGGQALHGHRGSLYGGGGSGGCVNLTVADAQRLWDLLVVGDFVHVWGRKPGT